MVAAKEGAALHVFRSINWRLILSLFAGKFAGEMIGHSKTVDFFALNLSENAQAEAGFRFGSVGTHSS